MINELEDVIFLDMSVFCVECIGIEEEDIRSSWKFCSCCYLLKDLPNTKRMLSTKYFLSTVFTIQRYMI